MNTEDIVNQILPILQEKLNVTTSGDILDALRIPANKPNLVPAFGSRDTGSSRVPGAAKEVISFPRLGNRLSPISIKDLLRSNPEAEDGLLRPPEIRQTSRSKPTPAILTGASQCKITPPQINSDKASGPLQRS